MNSGGLDEINTRVQQENDTRDFAPKLWSNMLPMILIFHVDDMDDKFQSFPMTS